MNEPFCWIHQIKVCPYHHKTGMIGPWLEILEVDCEHHQQNQNVRIHSQLSFNYKLFVFGAATSQTTYDWDYVIGDIINVSKNIFTFCLCVYYISNYYVPYPKANGEC